MVVYLSARRKSEKIKADRSLKKQKEMIIYCQGYLGIFTHEFRTRRISKYKVNFPDLLTGLKSIYMKANLKNYSQIAQIED